MLLGAVAGAILPAGALAQSKSGDAKARPQTCSFRPFRWQEDCRNLHASELHGLEKLRYIPLDREGDLWLTLGGEARARLDALHDVDFGIRGQPGYDEVSGRLLAHVDLRSRAGPRLFWQLGIVQESGRKPGPRPQDMSSLDLTQAFVDLPVQFGSLKVTARLGRQELYLSGNRLVTARDGTTLRRTFEGVKLDGTIGRLNIAFVRVHPIEPRPSGFDDHADTTERLTALSVDLPVVRRPALLNIFLFKRDRLDARYLRAKGEEHRYSLGAHYIGKVHGFDIDTQATMQFGVVSGRPVRAYSTALSVDHEIDAKSGASVGVDFVRSSGDNGRTRAVETFDPTYPNNYGVSDAPLLYQTNYTLVGGSVTVRQAGVIWTAGTNLLARSSTTDAVYASGAPINANFGKVFLSSALGQISARAAIRRNSEIYASVVRAVALGGITDAGGASVFYSRVQVTTRF